MTSSGVANSALAAMGLQGVRLRNLVSQAISLGLIMTSALMIWKGLMVITGSESPVVVVLSGSMEPGFKRGDILFLRMSSAPIQIGEIAVFNVEGRGIPIVHRIIKVHEDRATKSVSLLTKGDANSVDDYMAGLYADRQRWLNRKHIVGRAVGYLPHAGWVTIIMTDFPAIKGGVTFLRFQNPNTFDHLMRAPLQPVKASPATRSQGCPHLLFS